MRTKLTVSRVYAVVCLVAAVAVVFPQAARSADDPAAKKPKIADLLNQSGSGGFENAKPKLLVSFTPPAPRRGEIVTLSIQLSLPPGSYTYPLKAAVGSNTKIVIKEARGLKALPFGDFAPVKPPQDGL